MLKHIEEEAKPFLNKISLSVHDLRARRGFKSTTDKKALLYLFLRNKGYSWKEIGDYCYKDHSTVIKVCQKRTDLVQKYSHLFSHIILY